MAGKRIFGRLHIAMITPLCALSLLAAQSKAEVTTLRFGGTGGQSWADWSDISVVVETEASPGAIQPLELKPDENIISRLGPWERWREPREPWWQPGLPRIWRGNEATSNESDWDPRLLLDQDISTGFAQKHFGGLIFIICGCEIDKEFYTLDLGVSLPIERFVVEPPDGQDELSGEPFRPSFSARNFEVTGDTDLSEALNQVGGYSPLPIHLDRVESNFKVEAEARWPLRNLRLIRYIPLADDLGPRIHRAGGFDPESFQAGSSATQKQPYYIEKYGLAELELYGRGIVPEATWESKVVDLGVVANVGRIQFAVSRWRREGDKLVEAPGAQVTAKVALKVGLDDTPRSFFTYDQMGRLIETTQGDYTDLKNIVYAWNAPSVGWRGPIVDDTSEWSFWSAPLTSGERPRLPRGRYLKVQVRLETDSLWEFARVESLAVESAPVLAERVMGEIAVAGNLRPPLRIAEVGVGETNEFVYDVGADFAPDQPGFDALRLFTPSSSRVLGLETGDPLAVTEPDSIVEETGGFAVYLPDRIEPNGGRHLRLRFETAVYDAAGEVAAEVFDRSGDSVPQKVDPGDVSDEVGTDQLRVLATSSSLKQVLGEVRAAPRTITPQGDGVNDRVELTYSLFSVQSTQVEVGVYTLDGTRVRQVFSGPQSSGPQLQSWDGRDDQGRVAGPGLYVLRVEVDADDGRHSRVHSVAVAY